MSAIRSQLDQPRLSRFFAASAGIHLLAVGVLAIASSGAAWKPQLEITWLDLDNTLGAPQPAQKKATLKPTPQRATKLASAKMAPEANKPSQKDAQKRVKQPAKVAAKKPTAPREPFTTKKVKLTNMAPGNAALMLLLRMDRIRGTRQADSVRRLLEVFYDYKTLLWSRAIDPVRDFDAMLIATPNPYRVTKTFLAIRHQLPRGKLQSALEDSAKFDGKQLTWNRARGGGQLLGIIPTPPRLPHDDRVVLLRRGLALLCRPQHQQLLRRRPKPPKDETARSDDDPEPTLLQRLLSMDREGGDKPRQRNAPGLLLQAVNLPRLVRLPHGLPPPQNLQVTVPATESALVEGVLSFTSNAEATRFLAGVGPQIERAKRSLLMRLLGVSRLLGKLRLKTDGSRVLAKMLLTGREVRELLELFRTSIPQVRVPGMAPRVRSTRAAPPAADGGTAPAKAHGPDAGTTDSSTD